MKNKKNINKNAQRKAEEIAKEWQYDGRIKSDVNGSYTGTPDNQGERPIQDADDL